MSKTVHVIGAGVSGLSAGVRLSQAGFTVHVHEATHQAGGRCRSYFDGATQLTVDNGNHLVLSGNAHVRDYTRTIGTEDKLVGPESALFPFADVKTGKRWTLDLGTGRIPFWLFNASRRVPDTSVLDYLKLMPLVWSSTSRHVRDAITCEGTLYERLVGPLLLAALNVDPPEGSAGLAGAIVRKTLLAGGAACRPLIAREGLSKVLVDPAIAFVEARGGSVSLGHEVHRIGYADQRVTSLDFGGSDIVELNPSDAVVLAVPPRPAATLLPGLSVPTEYRAIVNAHFRHVPPVGTPPMVGIVNGIVDWVFAFDDRLSITISNADQLVNLPREELAQKLWDEVCLSTGITAELPAWQINRERRATFASTREQNALRPGAETQYQNLVLAGDWTDTGLPATIEGSIQSGDKAAQILTSRG